MAGDWEDNSILKIVIICRGLAVGGSGKIAAEIANYFASSGHDVYYVAVVYAGREYFLDERIKYTYINPSKRHEHLPGLKKNIEVYKFLKQEEPDVIISFVTRPLFISSLFLKIPMVFSLRNDPQSVDCDFFTRHIRNFEYRKARTVVFQTPGARDYFSKEIQKKGTIIANPLPTNLPYWKKSLTEKYIVCTCRIEPQKDIPTLLKAFKKFHSSHPEFLLRICGEGSEMNQMKEMCKELNIANSVIFMGFCADVYTIVAGASISVLTSKFEGLSNSMLESLAIGVPTICTDCPPGGAALYIKDHENGILIPVGDIEALNRSLNELADNEKECINLSKKAIEIRKELDYKNILSQWDKIINCQ